MKRRTLLGSLAAALCFWKAKSTESAPHKTNKPFRKFLVRGAATMYADDQNDQFLVVVPDVDGEGVWYHGHGKIAPVIVDGEQVDAVHRAYCHRVMWLPYRDVVVPIVVEISSSLHRESYVLDRGEKVADDHRWLIVSTMDRYNRSLKAANEKGNVT